MRLPSLAVLGQGARAAVVRFPAPALAAGLATYAAFQLIAAEGEDKQAIRLLMAALLGLPLGVALTVTLERVATNADVRRAVAPLAALGITGIVAGAFWLGSPGWSETIVWTRFVQLAVLFHLLAAGLPFLGGREPNAFWQFNRLILTRWLIGGVYAATLFFGLALALAALDNLFGIEVRDQVYGRLWVTMAFLFHPLFFLAGVPRDLAALEHDQTQPAGLRAFANFVLVPLTILYLAIVTAYFIKILATGQWPSGWIGWIVSGAAAVGIVTLLLASPPAGGERPPWVASFERWFWPALIPAVIMVGLAAWKRIAQYGFTERRYFLAVLTLWLGAVTVAFILRRRRPFIVIPASLAAVALLTFAGPWSAYRVSERSQLGRLTELLTRLGMLDGGSRITPAAEGVDRAVGTEAADVARYLATTHGPRRFGRWLAARGVHVSLADTADQRLQRSPGWEERRFAAAALRDLGLDRFPEPGRESIWVSRPSGGILDVGGWDYLLPLSEVPRPDSSALGGDSLSARLGGNRRSVEVWRGPEAVAVVDLGPGLDAAATWRLRDAEAQVPESLLTVRHEGARSAALVQLRELSLRDSAGAWRAHRVRGDVLLRLRRPE